MTHRAEIRTASQLGAELARRTELGAKMFNYLTEKSLLRDFKIDTSTWVSRSRSSEGKIWLGVGDIDTEKLESLYFGRTTQSDATLHRFMHEMAHLYLLDPQAEESEKIESLRQFASGVRLINRGKRGLSAIGSDSFYREKKDRVEEDITDLVAMRQKGAQGLGRFATFLTDSSSERKLNQLGLAYITRDAADHLVEIVESVVEPVRRY